MSVGANDLCLVSDVQTYLGLPSGTDAVLLQQLVTAASGFIQAWLNRTFLITTYTETKDGNDGVRMMMRNYPLISVSAVSVDQQVMPVAPNSGQQGFYFDYSSVMLNGYTFNRGYGNVVITYSAGYATVPFEIAQACIELVSLKYKMKDRIGLSQKGLAGETTTYTLADMLPGTKTILLDYRRVVPA